VSRRTRSTTTRRDAVRVAERGAAPSSAELSLAYPEQAQVRDRPAIVRTRMSVAKAAATLLCVVVVPVVGLVAAPAAASASASTTRSVEREDRADDESRLQARLQHGSTTMSARDALAPKSSALEVLTRYELQTASRMTSTSAAPATIRDDHRREDHCKFSYERNETGS